MKAYDLLRGNAYEEELENGVSKFAGKFFDKDASLLLGAGWEKVKDAGKQAAIGITILAAALYFYEHSRWHRPELKVEKKPELDLEKLQEELKDV